MTVPKSAAPQEASLHTIITLPTTNCPILFTFKSKNDQDEIISSSNRIEIESHTDKDKKVQTAPGYDIFSTLPPRRYLRVAYREKTGTQRSIASNNNNNYGHLTGTSQATGFGTGVVALVTTKYPNWSMEKVIDQVAKTGYGQGTDKIKQTTNQGKKLDAYKALTMRGQNELFSDQISNDNSCLTNTGKQEDKQKGIALIRNSLSTISYLSGTSEQNCKPDVYAPSEKK